MIKTKTNKILVLIIVCLLLFVSLQKCKSTGVEPEIKTTYKTEVEHKTHIDTIPFYNIIDSIRWETLSLISETSNADSSEYKYITAIEDSLIGGRIHTTVAQDGTLVTQDFTYLPKFPKYIYQRDSIFIERTITNVIQKKEWGIYGGVMLAPYKNLSLIGTVGVKTKNDLYIGVGYGPFEQNMYIDFKFPIIKNKNYVNR